MPHTIYDALRESHERQRSLCRSLTHTHDHSKSLEIFRELRTELWAHATAEERFLYAPILMDDMGVNSSRHALHEHHEIDECVEELEKSDPSQDTWSARAKKLSEEVHHHLKEEESKFFQMSGKILSDAQKIALAKDYQRDYERLKQARH